MTDDPTNVVPIRKISRGKTVRPLEKTYDPYAPFVVERHDQEDGSFHYEIWDTRPEYYRRLCNVYEPAVADTESEGPEDWDRGQAKKDAELIVTALNRYINNLK